MQIEEIQERLDVQIKQMTDEGCQEADIIDLLKTFSSEIQQNQDAFNEHAEQDQLQFIKSAQYTLFIAKIEGVVNTQLETLRDFILKSYAEQMTFEQYYTAIGNWAIEIWKQRSQKEETEKKDEQSQE